MKYILLHLTTGIGVNSSFALLEVLIFDEHSEDISYRQQYLDKNAFLVYYTKGFDGVNRPSIEVDGPGEMKEKRQYGDRNDAWIALDDAKAELKYIISSGNSDDRSDLMKSLRAALVAVDDYINADTPEDIETANKLMK